MKLHHAFTFGAAALLLAACGGGSAESAALDSNKVPASATASSRAYTVFVGSLQATESGTPLDVSDVVAPSTEFEQGTAI